MPKAEAASKFELRVLYPVSPLSLLPTCPWGQGEDHRVPLVSCPDFAGCMGLGAIFAAVCIILHFIETLSHAFWPTASIGFLKQKPWVWLFPCPSIRPCLHPRYPVLKPLHVPSPSLTLRPDLPTFLRNRHLAHLLLGQDSAQGKVEGTPEETQVLVVISLLSLLSL